MEMSLDDAIAAKKAAEDEFIELCRRGREEPNGVHISEFSKNLTNYRNACNGIWSGWFRNIADTGVKIIGHNS